LPRVADRHAPACRRPRSRLIRPSVDDAQPIAGDPIRGADSTAGEQDLRAEAFEASGFEVTDGTVADVIDAQIQQQGVSVIRVSDGHVFTFTLETLEALTERAREAGKVVLFVQTGAVQ
jgi:hypothetical protein